MVKEKFPQAEYAEFIGDGVYFDEKPGKPVSVDEKKKADEVVDARERSLGDMNDALLDDAQGESKLPRVSVSTTASLKPTAPFVKKIPKIPEFQEQFPKEKKPEKKNELGDINDALMEHPAVSSSPKEPDAIPQGALRADPDPVRAPDPRVRIGRDSLESLRQKYINDYSKNVAKMGVIKKTLARVGNWFGFKNKHQSFQNADVKAAQQAFDKRQDMSVAERLAEVGQTYETRTRNERVGSDGKIIERKEAFERYQKIMKRIETAREEAHGSGEGLRKVKEERDALQAEREKAWKSEFMDTVSEKWNRISQDKWAKRTIGNRYFRAAVLGGLSGFFTGGLTSSAFWLTRVARLGAGAVAGKETKKFLDKKLNEEEILIDRLATLDEKFQNKQVTRSEYDQQRLSIDTEIQRIRRLKDLLTASAGAAAGMGAGALADGAHSMVVDKLNGTPLMPHGVEYENPSAETNPAPTPVQDPEAMLPPTYEYPPAMPVSSLGALDTIEKYKVQLAAFYEGKPIPPVAQHFMDTPTADLAKEIGAWDPNTVNESHIMPKGSTIGLKDGAVSYHNSVTGADTEVLKTLGSRAGEVVVPTSNHLEMFDSGAHVSVDGPLEVPTTPGEPLTGVSENIPDEALSGGMGGSTEQLPDKPLESKWFNVKDESAIVGADDVRTPTSVERIESQPITEVGPKPEVPVENVEQMEPLDIAKINPELIPLVDENPNIAPYQGNEPVETQVGSSMEPEQPVVTEAQTQETTTELKGKTPEELGIVLKEGQSLVGVNSPFIKGNLIVEIDPTTGQYSLGQPATGFLNLDTTSELWDKLGTPQSYLVDEKIMNGMSSLDESKLLSALNQYRLNNAYLNYAGFSDGSIAHQAVLNDIQSLKGYVEKNFGTGILKDITVPQPVR
jgi:hypothetical protein